MEKGKVVWLYDILLDGFIVGTQGDLEFNSKEEAEKDARSFILSVLMEEHGKQENDFAIKYYEVTD
jgi:hypothetical protein